MFDRLQYARVLTALGELREAEREVAGVLDRRPDDASALSLYAKIKHLSGELSLAIACWAQLHARSTFAQAARLHISSLVALARAPAKNAGDFLAMSQWQLVKKPVAYLELESAFQLYLARRPVEARHHCLAVADKYQGRDRDVYKLAMLSEAWISEHIGELEAACATLEQLGRDKELAGDLDRVLTLASLYERIGTRERLEAAMHIYRFLERTRAEGVQIYGYLARGYRLLGDAERAERYEALHLEAFRRGMDRPSAADVVAVAAEHYLPLDRLQALFDDDRAGKRAIDPPALSPRETAITAALGGDFPRASELLATGASPLDRLYRADLARMAGDGKQAARWMCEAIAELDEARAMLSPWAIGLTLELRQDEPKAVTALVRDPDRAERLARVIEERIALSPADARPWRWLATLRALDGSDAALRARCEARAAALEKAQSEGGARIGHALAAAVYQFVGKPKGIVHEVWAGREPVGRGQGGTLPLENLHGNLTDDMRGDVRNIFCAVREYARAKLPHLTADLDDYRYSFKVTKEDEPSGGRSAGLAAALAFLSVFLQRALPKDLAASGAIVADSHLALMVTPVGDVEYKARAAYHCHLRKLLLPAGNRGHFVDSPLVPRYVQEQLIHFVATLDDALAAAFGEDIFY